MLCNLQELQQNLKFLIGQFSQIHNKLITPIESKKLNSKNSILIKIPKVLLLIRITPYLQQNDIVTLSSVCVAMRRTIYSPIGWKIINQIHSPYPILVRQIYDEEYGLKMKANFSETECQLINQQEDQKLLKKARAECKKQLMITHERYKIKSQEYEQLIKKLKSQKTQVIKMKLHATFLKQIKHNLQSENSDNRTKLKQINKGFSDRIKGLDNQYEQLLKERNKLQSQKEALVGKIRQYQTQIDNIKYESEKSKRILKKIKNYLLYQEL